MRSRDLNSDPQVCATSTLPMSHLPSTKEDILTKTRGLSWQALLLLAFPQLLYTQGCFGSLPFSVGLAGISLYTVAEGLIYTTMGSGMGLYGPKSHSSPEDNCIS